MLSNTCTEWMNVDAGSEYATTHKVLEEYVCIYIYTEWMNVDAGYKYTTTHKVLPSMFTECMNVDAGPKDAIIKK